MKNKFIKKLAAVAVASSLVLGLVACGGSESGTKDSASNSEEGLKEINYAMTSDPDILDASRSDDAQKSGITLEVQETLVRNDASGELVPAGAESWTTSEDGLVWTFTLRDNKYSDGSEVVAADYVNGVLRTLEPEVGSHNAGMFYVVEGGQAYNAGEIEKEEVGVKALDNKTLEITLTEPVPYFLSLINNPAVTPIPESDTEGDLNTTYGSDAEEMVYSGPFMIESWNRGESIILAKNPNFWDAENVEIDKINMLLAEEVNTRQQMFEQGQVDLIEGITAEYHAISEEKIEAREIVLEEFDKPAFFYIAFNNQDPNGIFTNAKIRLAFSLAIEREPYVDNVIKKDQVAYGIIPTAIANGEVNFRDNVEEPLKSVMHLDPKELLEEGLKEIGKEGEQLQVIFLQGNANNDTKVKSEYFQNQWETKLGVDVIIDTAADSATFNQQVAGGSYQIANTGWGADYNDPMSFMGLFVTGDGNNASFGSNEEYDQIISEVKNSTDIELRQEKLARAEEIVIAEEAFIAPLAYGAQKNLVSSSVTGLVFNGSGGPNVEFRYADVE